MQYIIYIYIFVDYDIKIINYLNKSIKKMQSKTTHGTKQNKNGARLIAATRFVLLLSRNGRIHIVYYSFLSQQLTKIVQWIMCYIHLTHNVHFQINLYTPLA